MKDRLNCPNCGAPIEGTECPYCGTVFHDFATFAPDKPTYIRTIWHDSIITARVILKSATVEFKYFENPSIEFEFMAVPDDDGTIIKQEKGEIDEPD